MPMLEDNSEIDTENARLGRWQSVTLMNEGNLDVLVFVATKPSWIELEASNDKNSWSIQSKSNLTLPFRVDIKNGPDGVFSAGTVSSLISFQVDDDNYPDCFHSQIMSFTVTLQIIPEQELNYLEFVKYVSYTLGGLVMLVSFCCAVWVHQHSETHMVKASQPIFLYMLCVGTSVMGLSIVPLGIDDETSTIRACNAACMIFPWLLTSGFSISFSALFAKIWRINKIVKAAERFKRMHVQPVDVLIPFFVIFSCNVILLLLWTIIDPLQFDRVVTSDHESYGTCWAGTDSAVPISLGILIAILNFGAVVLANLQAYQARDLKVEYNESKYIGIGMGCILQAFMLGVPLMFLVAENPQAFTFLLSSLIFLIAMSLLVLIFIPKFFFLWKKGNAPITKRESQLQSGPLGSNELSLSKEAGSHSSPLHMTSSLPESHGDANSGAVGLRITSVVINDDDEPDPRQQQNEIEIKYLRQKIRRLQRMLTDSQDKLQEAGIITEGDSIQGALDDGTNLDGEELLDASSSESLVEA